MHLKVMNGLREEWFRKNHEQVFQQNHPKVRRIETHRRRAKSRHDYMQALEENMIRMDLFGGRLSRRHGHQLSKHPIPAVTTTGRYQNEILGGNLILIPDRYSGEGGSPIEMFPVAANNHNTKFIVVSAGRDFTSDATEDRATITRLVENNTPEDIASTMMYPMTSLEMIEKNLKVFAFVEELRSLWKL